MFATVVLIAAALSIAPASAAGEIGRVRAVKFAAYGTPPAESRHTLYVWDEVFTNEIVETSKNSALHLAFLDKSIFRLGAESRATLDRFVYDPDSTSGELALNLKEGIFRIKTGKMKKEGVRVVTPVAVITVTGTDFVVEVLANLIRLAVLEGEITVSPTAVGALQTTLAAPARAEIDMGGAVTPGVGPDSDPGLEDDAGFERNKGDSGDRDGGDTRGGSESLGNSLDSVL